MSPKGTIPFNRLGLHDLSDQAGNRLRTGQRKRSGREPQHLSSASTLAGVRLLLCEPPGQDLLRAALSLCPPPQSVHTRARCTGSGVSADLHASTMPGVLVGVLSGIVAPKRSRPNPQGCECITKPGQGELR